MTLQMILALGILILMIVMIMSDKFAFGAPPVFACLLLVATGLSTVQEAFAGFINPSVVMVAGFMVVMAALMKTSFIAKVQTTMISLVNKGGYKSYALLLIVVMLGASLAGMGSTGYYVLILSLVSTIPYNKKMPTSKLMMPLGFATNHPLVPINVALTYGVTVSVLETAGFTTGVSMFKFAIVNFILSLGFLAWSLVAYKMLPDHPITQDDEETPTDQGLAVSMMTPTQEKITIAMFIISVIGMMMMSQLGNFAYVLPGLAASVILFTGGIDFRSVRDNMGAPVILMMAGVIGVADALANSGFTKLIGDWVAHSLGTNMSPFVLILIFVLLTSTSATFTGSNMGSVFIFAPIVIATCISLNWNPTAAAVAVVISGWNGGYMPVDGMPAMILGMGNYKLPEFWKYSVPMYLVRVLALTVGALLVFPV
ncbi:SLC13 family permease [Streptococcus massiliensis]|uniref:Transporter, divalent anion:Na+ symporter (DASS) family n=1 Tax=Streptococcus massiliensis TaxID=313439 RepID=A0A380KVV0_9STRE|nr:SLC13 family permease [Streptococcus massiliensis]SUN76042.1 transporter, divalent anion:Na+ symporter (DASS) family [Streptococcus massiliensis]